MHKHGLKIVFLLILISSFGDHINGQSTKATADEYAIFGRVLRSIYAKNRRDYTGDYTFILLTKTIAEPNPRTPEGRQYRQLIRNFEKANRSSLRIEKSFPIATYLKKHEVVSRGELDEMFRIGEIAAEKEKQLEKESGMASSRICGSTHWRPFYTRFPAADGYYELSRVGFSKSLAMVHVDRSDACSGFSRTYILRKRKGTWRIIKTMSLEWVA